MHHLILESAILMIMKLKKKVTIDMTRTKMRKIQTPNVCEFLIFRHFSSFSFCVSVHIHDHDYDFLTGCSLWFNQVLAMLMKRGLSILRSWIIFLLQNLIPIISVIVVIIVMRTVGSLKDPSALTFTLDSYNDPITTLNRSVNNKYAEEYINALKSQNKKIIDWQQKNYIEKMLEEVLLLDIISYLQ